MDPVKAVMVTAVVTYADGRAVTIVQQNPESFKSKLDDGWDRDELLQSFDLKNSPPTRFRLEWEIGDSPAQMILAGGD